MISVNRRGGADPRGVTRVFHGVKQARSAFCRASMGMADGAGRDHVLVAPGRGVTEQLFAPFFRRRRRPRLAY
eukprot:2151117-Prymnesium_polylepis.1